MASCTWKHGLDIQNGSLTWWTDMRHKHRLLVTTQLDSLASSMITDCVPSPYMIKLLTHPLSIFSVFLFHFSVIINPALVYQCPILIPGFQVTHGLFTTARSIVFKPAVACSQQSHRYSLILNCPLHTDPAGSRLDSVAGNQVLNPPDTHPMARSQVFRVALCYSFANRQVGRFNKSLFTTPLLLTSRSQVSFVCISCPFVRHSRAYCAKLSMMFWVPLIDSSGLEILLHFTNCIERYLHVYMLLSAARESANYISGILW